MPCSLLYDIHTIHCSLVAAFVAVGHYWLGDLEVTQCSLSDECHREPNDPVCIDCPARQEMTASRKL